MPRPSHPLRWSLGPVLGIVFVPVCALMYRAASDGVYFENTTEAVGRADAARASMAGWAVVSVAVAVALALATGLRALAALALPGVVVALFSGGPDGWSFFGGVLAAAVAGLIVVVGLAVTAFRRARPTVATRQT